jgi:hypothetical protein
MCATTGELSNQINPNIYFSREQNNAGAIIKLMYELSVHVYIFYKDKGNRKKIKQFKFMESY